jgi:hypothetical protein
MTTVPTLVLSVVLSSDDREQFRPKATESVPGRSPRGALSGWSAGLRRGV